MKKVFYLFLGLLFSRCATFNQDKCNVKLEKGVFLYEINVPLRYYTFEDVIETPERMLKFPTKDDLLIESYKNGLYFFSKEGGQIDSLISNIENDKNCYDIKSIKQLSNELSFVNSDYYIKKYETYYWINNMAFMKFYAEFYFVDVGQIEEMIPKLENYKCCYSNVKEKINGKIIVKVKKFKLLKE
jgi:hypothetical protein